MKSFTKTESKNGILSYGLYMMYKNRFKYRLEKKGGKTEFIKYTNPVMELNNIKYIDKKSEANVPYYIWLRICKKFNKMKMDSILHGVIFKFPYRLGSIGVVQDEPRLLNKDGNLKSRLGVDWNKTFILWKKLYPEVTTNAEYKKIKDKPVCYYTNEHTDGRVFRIHWKKRFCNVKNKTVYSLKVPPQYKQALSRIIFGNPNVQYCTKF